MQLIRVNLWLVVTSVSWGLLRADFSFNKTIRHGRQTMASAKHIKGNRLAIIQTNHTTVIDLDKEAVVEIDFLKKAYQTVPFAQIEPGDKAKSGTNASSRLTGASKSIGVLPAKQMILKFGNTSVDAWISSVPGWWEVRNFEQKLGNKLGWGYLSGSPDLPDVSEAMHKLGGVPLLARVTEASGEVWTIELDQLNSAPVDRSKFDVPAGFKKAP